MPESKKLDKKSDKKLDKKSDKGSGSNISKSEPETTLSVAIYQPHWGSLHHWALSLKCPDCTYIYQVVGEAMNFTAEVCDTAVPEDSARFVESIKVAKINDGDVVALHNTIISTPVQNDVVEWCCQDYVIEALKLLNEEQIVDDEDYKPAKRRLDKRFNH